MGNNTGGQAVKFNLYRVYVNAGGYADKGWRYYGTGAPLYRAQADDPTNDRNIFEEEVRAYSRDEAKDKVRAMYPNATFYR